MKNEIKITKKIEFDLIVMDAMNYFYKYYFVHKNLFNKKKDWTGLYYGFFNKIQNLERKHKKANIIIAWDRDSTVRKQINSNYKANRGSEDKKAKEKKELRKMLSMYSIFQYYINGYEADDVIAKIVKMNKDKIILVMSSDKDLFQLLADNVYIARKENPKAKEKIYSKEDIETSFNIKIESYTLYKAIIGDRGDNVFGIYRINKMEVKKFVNSIWGDISLIYSITRMKRFGKIKNKIIMNFGKIEENYKLVKLYTDFDLKEIKRVKNTNKLIKLFKKYEMNQALSGLKKG